jgi:type VI secretion system protein
MKTNVSGGNQRRCYATALGKAGGSVAASIVLIVLPVLLEAGCSVGGKIRSGFGGQLPISVIVVPGANDDSPIAVDFVIAYDQKVLDEIVKVSAAEWFSKKSRFLADHPQELVVEGREWVPGQPVAPLSIPYRIGARKVVVFADYHSGGEHRAIVPPQQPSVVTLGETDLKVEARQ